MFSAKNLKQYEQTNNRASSYVLDFWQKIEKKIVYCLGLYDDFIMTIFIDDAYLSYSISSQKEIIANDHFTLSSQHVLTTIPDISCTMTLNIVSGEFISIGYENCSLYYYEKKDFDDYDIEIECATSFNVKTYKMFKASFMFDICREFQYLIHLAIFNSDIEKDTNVHYDVLYECVKVYCSVLDDLSFEESCNNLLKSNKITPKELVNLEEIKKIITFKI